MSIEAPSRRPQKKNGQIVIHLPHDLEMEFRALADMEGSTASEKGRSLVIEFLDSRKQQFEAMKSIYSKKS